MVSYGSNIIHVGLPGRVCIRACGMLGCRSLSDKGWVSPRPQSRLREGHPVPFELQGQPFYRNVRPCDLVQSQDDKRVDNQTSKKAIKFSSNQKSFNVAGHRFDLRC